MTRLLSLLVVLALGGALLLSPEPDPARLVALEVWRTLEEPVEGDPGGRSLGEAVLQGGSVRETGERERTLRLGGVRLASVAGAAVELDVHGEVRASLLRGLRASPSLPEGTTLEVEGERVPVEGGAELEADWDGERLSLQLQEPGEPAPAPLRATRAWSPPDRSSLVPPLVAIALAILLRRPVISLFLGVVSACWLIRYAAGVGPLKALLAALAWVPGGLGGEGSELSRSVGWQERLGEHLPDWLVDFLWPQLVDPDRAMLIGFVVFMLAMVGVITRAGGIRGLMDRIAGMARGVRRTQVCAYLMGLVVFFDDYANTILVGSTMRPLTDRYRISREKLAYIVDSTAAPVAGLAVLSTWIAFEVSTFSAQLPAAGLSADQGYQVFLQSLPYRFYCVFTLALVGLVAITGRDFGPMLAAERRARGRGLLVREGGKPMVSERGTSLEPAEGVVPRAAGALWPILTFLLVTLLEIARAGGAFALSASDLQEQGFLKLVTGVLYEGSGNRPLLVGSGSGLLMAVAIAQAAGLSFFRQILGAAWRTLRAMGIAIAILYLAWMIGAACEELGTAPYLSVVLGGRLSAPLLPTLLFLLAALVAFSTGSSWSTMTILLPLVVGLAFNLGETAGIEGITGHFLLLISIGAVLEGAIFGDHCSPISDTTVLSSTASASDHIDHVRTQAPYALLTMLVAMVVGYLPCAFFPVWKPWYGFGAGLAVLLAALLLFGRRAEASPEIGAPPSRADR